MEKLRNLSLLGRQHYEKIILSVALMLLAGAVLYLFGESRRQVVIIRGIPTDFAGKAVKAVGAVNLSANAATLKRAEKPLALEFSGPHNLFNPVEWRINKGATEVTKVVSSDQVGAPAMRLAEPIRSIHLAVAFGQTATSGVGDQLVVNGYVMYVTNELYVATARQRVGRLFVSLNATNKDAPFILRDVQGTPQEPTGLTGEFKEGGEKFSFAPGQAFFKSIGFEANLRFPNSTNTTGFLRKGSSIDIDGLPHKVVDITSNAVVLSEDSNGKQHSVTKSVAP